MDEKIEIEEKTHLLGKVDVRPTYIITTEVRVYRRRWWVAAVLIYAAIMSGMTWYTVGTLSESVKTMFGWTNGDIGMITNITNFTFILFVVPVCLMVETKGLKVCTIGSAVCLFIGCVIRCFTLDPRLFYYMWCVTAALAGVASIVPYAGPALIASIWFPQQERAMVTGVIAFCNYIGASIAFIVAPRLVPSPVIRNTIATFVYNASNTSENASGDIPFSPLDIIDKHGHVETIAVENIEEMKKGMANLMYLFAALGTVFLVCTLIYFPAKPPKPPSISACVPRTDYRRAVVDILRNKQHWLVVLAGSMPRGIIASWVGVFDIPASNVGISQQDAGMVAFCATIIGASSGLLFSKISYRLGGRSRPVVIVLSVIGTIFSTWGALIFTKILEAKLVSVYISVLAIGVLTYGTVPLFYEMSAEAAFPVSESVAGGVYTLALHVVSVVYFAAMSIPGVGLDWMTWAVLVASALSLPLMAMFNERNKRSELDKTYILI